jgi:hypothetical protein
VTVIVAARGCETAERRAAPTSPCTSGQDLPYFWILLKILATTVDKTASGSQSFLNAALPPWPHRAIADRVAAVLGGGAVVAMTALTVMATCRVDQSLGPGQADHDARPHKSCDDTADNTCDVGGTDAEGPTPLGTTQGALTCW